ncbi:MAG TPA: OmpH family outer membrane protein [Planctomycetaceae bacterium]|nr:OmpH family outer membrane protein [Planctomycetaceae bacterium]
MRSTISVLVLVFLWVPFSGCGKFQEKSVAKAVGGVGVVDLDVVAKRIGRDIEMQKAVQDEMDSLNGKLATLQTSLNRIYEEKRDKLGESPTEEQLKDLQAWQDRTSAQLLESRRKAEVDLSNYRQSLIERFREQAKPVLREVADARGLSIVVPKNNGLLLSIDPAVEITDEVAKRMPAAPTASASEETEPVRSKSKKPAAETSAR